MSSATYLAVLSVFANSALADIHNVAVPSGFFSGPQSGIGSWFTAYGDAMNGHSWCGYPYSNSDSVFAVSLKAMGGATYNSDPNAWKQQTQKYCGLEAKVTDPSTGKSMLMYIGDAFDDAWVKTPTSIDIMVDAFTNVHGDPNGDHNKVIHDVKWELTGRVNTEYAAPGASWPASGEESDGEDTEKSDGESAPNSYGKSAEKSDGKSAPKSDGKSDGKSAPKSDGENAEKSYGKSAEKNDGKSSPTNYGENAGKNDGKSSPNSYGENAGKSDGGNAPKSDGDSAPKSDGDSAPKSYGKCKNKRRAGRRRAGQKM